MARLVSDNRRIMKPQPLHLCPPLPCLSAFAAAGLVACVSSAGPHDYLRQYDAIPKSSTRFTVCNLAGCEETTEVRLSRQDWRTLEKVFSPPPHNSHQERERIARAVAVFEQLTGEQAATYDDQAGSQGVFRTTRQLDCVAETANTTVYLLLLQQQGLLRWHTAEYPGHRGLIDLQAPHNTAVIVDLGNRERFAVDAYFHANGEAPEVVPIDVWSAGYKPQRTPDGAD